jgi:type II secretory ATPase GspE/PulE/Tfp pilus assembly ATPase PilB-like protein
MPRIKKILNSLLYQAVVDGASDIHIENLESRVRVRLRIDGLLQLREFPITKENIGQIVSVLKIESGLDITERRRPQDGGFKKRIGKDWMIDFRLNVHNTQFGPDAVIRILDNSKRVPKLDQIGFPRAMFDRYLSLIRNPQGLILITGPTGSGKSTTLCSTLNFLNLAEKKIVTAEDPVEYHLEGVCQYQVSDRLGNTFAEYGRRFLRKDPDIILIGETRDEETTEACLRAAMTGHMVFTTLHTNSSIAAVARLLDLGGDRSSICDAVLAVMAQRLVRKNCKACLEEYSPPLDLLEDFFGAAQPGVRLLRGHGCVACDHTGFLGRTGVYEMWELSRLCREAILGGEGESKLKSLAEKEGFKPLVADALEKVADGLTTLEELRRVTPLEQIRGYSAIARELYLNAHDGRLRALPSA